MKGSEKMELKDLIELGKMGFTKDDIVNFLNNGNGISESEPQKSGTEETIEETTESTETKPTESKENDFQSFAVGINALYEEMNKTLKDIQKANINNSNQPEIQKRNPEDIIGKIITPRNYRKDE